MSFRLRQRKNQGRFPLLAGHQCGADYHSRHRQPLKTVPEQPWTDVGPSGLGGLDIGSGEDRYHASLLRRSMTAWIATAVVLSPSPQTPVWKRGFERNVRTQMSYGWCTSWYVSSACTVPCGMSTGYTSRLQRMLLVTRHRGFQFSFVSNFVLNNTPREPNI